MTENEEKTTSRFTACALDAHLSAGLRSPRRGVVAATVVSVLASSAVVAFAAPGWTVHSSRSDRFRISTPASWIAIPGSRVAAARLASVLAAQGKPREAVLVRSYLRDNLQSREDRVLDGVQYPIVTSPILTDFLLVKDRLPSAFPSTVDSLQLVAGGIYIGLQRTPGVQMITRPWRVVKLAGGTSVTFSGTLPAAGFGKGARTGFVFYFFLGPRRSEWQIEFRTAADQLAKDAALFRRIANSFRPTLS